MIHEATPIIRYSPRPRSAYVNARGHGPWSDFRVSTPGAWNLAYLSFDLESELLHPDPMFLTLVRRSCQLNLDTLQVHLTGPDDSEDYVERQLLKPAPQFLKWLNAHPKVLTRLPLYQEHGAEWKRTIEQRARLCCTHDFEDEPIGSTAVASSLLQRFRRT